MVDKNAKNILFIETDAEWMLLARKRLEMNQVDLAKLIGISSVTLSNIENNKCDLSPYLRLQVTNLLKKQKVVE